MSAQSPTPHFDTQLVVAVGSDHAGFNLKRLLVEQLWAWLGEERVLDLGARSAARCDYPDYAEAVADQISAGRATRGVLVCGTGIGMSIAANKRPQIRAALCHDVTTARLARAHNDAQILCLGARVVGESVALEALEAFLRTPFERARHAHRLEKIAALEVARLK